MGADFRQQSGLVITVKKPKLFAHNDSRSEDLPAVTDHLTGVRANEGLAQPNLPGLEVK